MGLVIVNTSLLSVPVCNHQVPSAGRDPMVQREGSHSRRAQKSSLGAGFLSDSCQDRKIGVMLAFSLLELWGFVGWG